MNLMMAAMGPVMAFLMMGRDMRAMDPTEIVSWGVMSLGVIAGFMLAYPVNVWLVSRHLKHGLMTERKPGGRVDPAAPKGGKEPAAPAAKRPPTPLTPNTAMAAMASMGSEGKAEAESMGTTLMGADTTRPQLAAVAGVATLALLIGMILPANYVNLGLSVDDVGGTIMPRGMIMDRDTPAAAMRDMAAVLPRYFTAKLSLSNHGDQELQPRIENGVKVVNLDAKVVRWSILPGIDVGAYAFNNQVPGPRLHLTQGDKVRINVTNHLPESTSTHWHGLILPNVMDGPAELTQKPIESGETYRYEFTAVQSGTYFYHSHDHVDRQQSLGLYGAMIIDPANPADELKADKEYTIQLQE